MPRRSRDNQGIFLPKTPTSPHTHPSLFLSDCNVEHTIGESLENFEEPIGEEEEIASPKEPASPIQAMVETRTQGVFPIREIDGETRMKNINISTLPNFHGITSEDPKTFEFKFSVVYMTYDYASDDQNLKLFPSTLKDVALCWFMGLPRNNITT